MNRPAILLYSLLGALLFLVAGQFHAPLLEARRTEGLNQTEPIENAPPLVAFTTVALGGFRGIIADTLWIRATRMQRDGRFFELVQLSDWITKLEPRFTTVWAFHAWNLSYNVSVMFPSPEDRWRWVRHGLSLLTEDGLKYNPGAPDLYRELGWIYQHKISATQDNAHWYYKREWAREMDLLLPGGQLKAEVLLNANRFDAKKELELLDMLRQEFGFAFPRRAQDRKIYFEKAAELAPELSEKYNTHATLYILKNTYRFSIQSMHMLEKNYGKQDWRLPQVHAVYWAIQGREDSADFSQIALQRMISQSFADMFINGGAHLGSSAATSYPDVHLSALSGAQTAFREALKKFPGTATFKSAYKNFLQRAMYEVWLQGDDSAARDLHLEWTGLLNETEEPLSIEKILCGTLFGLYGQGPQTFSALQQTAQGQYSLWASRGQLARALRIQSIPLLCP